LTTEESWFDSRQMRQMFSSRKRWDRLWGSASFLYSEHCGLFHRYSSDWGLKLTTHTHISI